MHHIPPPQQTHTHPPTPLQFFRVSELQWFDKCWWVYEQEVLAHLTSVSWSSHESVRCTYLASLFVGAAWSVRADRVHRSRHAASWAERVVSHRMRSSRGSWDGTIGRCEHAAPPGRIATVALLISLIVPRGNEKTLLSFAAPNTTMFTVFMCVSVLEFWPTTSSLAGPFRNPDCYWIQLTCYLDYSFSLIYTWETINFYCRQWCIYLFILKDVLFTCGYRRIKFNLST